MQAAEEKYASAEARAASAREGGDVANHNAAKTAGELEQAKIEVAQTQETLKKERMQMDQELAALQKRVEVAEGRALDAETERSATDERVAQIRKQLVNAERKAADAELERVAAEAKANALEEYALGILTRVPNA